MPAKVPQATTRGRVAVTGGTGFLGRHVMRACAASGFDVIACSRATGVDLRNGEAFGEWLWKASADCVVHCAAHVGGIGYVGEHAVKVFHDNLEIGSGLLRGMHLAGSQALITIMPNCTYPGAKDIYREEEWWDGPLHESVLMYGLPRKVLWGLCETYGKAYGLRAAHLILPNLYGPGDHFDPKRSHALGALVRKMVDAAHEGASSIDVWGTGKPVREWMHVSDAAEAIATFLVRATVDAGILPSAGVLNVGIGEGISIAELAAMIQEAVGWRGRLRFDASRPDGALQKLLDGTKFRALTGWSPRVRLKDGIRETVGWYSEHSEKEAIHAHT